MGWSRQCECGAEIEHTRWMQGSNRCGACADALGRRRAIQANVAKIPMEYQWASFDSPDLPLRVQGRGLPPLEVMLGASLLALEGPAGAGKTSLMAALFRQVAETGATGLVWTDAFTLQSAPGAHPLGKGECPAVEAALGAELLALDDVGAEPVTLQSAVMRVIFDRHKRCARTWITSGFDPETLGRRYGDGISRKALERALRVRLGDAESAAVSA